MSRAPLKAAILLVTAAACTPWPDPCENGGDCPQQDAGPGETTGSSSSEELPSSSAQGGSSGFVPSSSSSAPSSSSEPESSSSEPSSSSSSEETSSSEMAEPSSSGDSSSSGAAMESSSSSSASSAMPSSSAFFPPGGWTLAVMPDTQHYATTYHDIFRAQTQWLRDNAQALNILFMVHEGDITHNNNTAEWTVAFDNITLLDGVIPYALTWGNHDIGPNANVADRTTLGDDEMFFHLSRYQSTPTFGGTFGPGDMQNSFHFFSAAGVDYLVIGLEFGPRDVVLEWAGQLCDQYSARKVIIVTHSYMFDDGTRCSPGDSYNPKDYALAQQPGASVNDGEDMWQKLVKHKPNIQFVFSGHHIETGISRRIDLGDNGNPVFQMLANYQIRVQGGEGYMRLLNFAPDGRFVRVKSFSPYLGLFLSDPSNEFGIDLQSGVYVP